MKIIIKKITILTEINNSIKINNYWYLKNKFSEI